VVCHLLAKLGRITGAFPMGVKMKEIPLTQGKVALVDDGDYGLVIQHKWYAAELKRHWYAVRSGQNHRMIFLHREIMNASAGVQVDHINGNGLDCRRENLRLCTPAENNRNSSKPRSNTSGYKGVTWHKRGAKWQAAISWNRKSIHLGLFSDPETAARAYDEAARKYHGAFAKTNF
jgi:hypothetical protein